VDCPTGLHKGHSSATGYDRCLGRLRQVLPYVLAGPVPSWLLRGRRCLFARLTTDVEAASALLRNEDPAVREAASENPCVPRHVLAMWQLLDLAHLRGHSM